uniref:Uncharacterized protein n=3 Tax=Oryza sativa subsp. japonica TaxID=39947 RepID=Q2R6Z8_ORYSJ|nr:hypothetical protein LOC_Os11g18320 [Oryza sativa Japonica Group]ABA92763.1 hypothetical protein LOC_Os11g18320 [Oryza sativa Japonica Group]
MTSGTIILTTGTDGGGSGDGNKSNEDGKGKGKHKHSGGDSGDGDEGKGEVRTLPSSLSRATASGTASNLNSKCRHGVLAVINWCAMIPTGVIGNMRKETNAGYMVTDGLVIAAGSSWATNSMEGWQKNRDRVSSLDDETLSRQGVARRPQQSMKTVNFRTLRHSAVVSAIGQPFSPFVKVHEPFDLSRTFTGKAIPQLQILG